MSPSARTFRQWIAVPLFLIVIAVLATYVWFHRHEFSEMLSLHPLQLLSLVALSTIQLMVVAACQSVMYHAVRRPLPFGESFHLCVAGNTINQVAPLQSGAVLRAMYLKKRHEVAYTVFVALSAAFQLLLLLSASVILMILSWFAADGAMLWLLLSAAGLVGGLCVVVICLQKTVTGWNRLPQLLRNSLQGWRAISESREQRASLMLLLMVGRVLDGVTFWFACECLGHDVSLLQSTVFSSAAAIMSVIRLTPGNLGLQESFFVLLGKLILLSTPQCVAVSLLLRLADIVRSFVFVPIAAIRLKLRYRDLRAPDEPA